jgi:2-polyprenyl-3-methyl-5-hydroxy-6-metoxy-1,4-benzoquinol methylase
LLYQIVPRYNRALLKLGLSMNCPICGGANYWTIPFAVDAKIENLRRDEGYETTYEWRLCRNCANSYPSDAPNLRVLQRVWLEHKSTPGLSVVEQAQSWAHRRTKVRKIATRSYRLFSPLAKVTGKRFLDIACGFGETVRTFADHGWDAEGIDADSSIAEVHREMGIHVRYGQIEEMDVGVGYDLIHIAHAIYFITDPMRFLREARKRLVESGVLCIVLSDFFAHHSLNLPSYAHTFFPTASSMRYALALAGLETILCKRRSGSIYIAAQPASAIRAPSVSPRRTRLLFRTKSWRYALVGRPFLTLGRAAKSFAGHR